MTSYSVIPRFVFDDLTIHRYFSYVQWRDLVHAILLIDMDHRVTNILGQSPFWLRVYSIVLFLPRKGLASTFITFISQFTLSHSIYYNSKYAQVPLSLPICIPTFTILHLLLYLFSYVLCINALLDCLFSIAEYFVTMPNGELWDVLLVFYTPTVFSFV